MRVAPPTFKEGHTHFKLLAEPVIAFHALDSSAESMTSDSTDDTHTHTRWVQLIERFTTWCSVISTAWGQSGDSEQPL